MRKKQIDFLTVSLSSSAECQSENQSLFLFELRNQSRENIFNKGRSGGTIPWSRVRKAQCLTSRLPRPSVRVLPGQQVVNDYTHKIVVKEDGVQSMIIVPAMPQDSGEWTVVAHNRAGRTTITVTLTVEGKRPPRPSPLSPRFPL